MDKAMKMQFIRLVYHSHTNFCSINLNLYVTCVNFYFDIVISSILFNHWRVYLLKLKKEIFYFYIKISRVSIVYAKIVIF